MWHRAYPGSPVNQNSREVLQLQMQENCTLCQINVQFFMYNGVGKEGRANQPQKHINWYVHICGLLINTCFLFKTYPFFVHTK